MSKMTKERQLIDISLQRISYPKRKPFHQKNAKAKRMQRTLNHQLLLQRSAQRLQTKQKDGPVSREAQKGRENAQKYLLKAKATHG